MKNYKSMSVEDLRSAYVTSILPSETEAILDALADHEVMPGQDREEWKKLMRGLDDITHRRIAAIKSESGNDPQA